MDPINFNLSTPTLVFPAITLLMLAFTNRFLAIATLVRNLHSHYLTHPDQPYLKDQIQNLKKRLTLIRWMQLIGILSLTTCVISMFLLFYNLPDSAKVAYIIGMCLLLLSLFFSVWEIQISTRALNYELKDME
ncbi:MAG: DUF2721 domain-containing protein [Saprospiraceae bacterium]